MNPNLAAAYLRQGLAAFHLDEYESAKVAFEKGVTLVTSKKQKETYETWIRKCDAEIEDDEESDYKAIESLDLPRIDPVWKWIGFKEENPLKNFDRSQKKFRSIQKKFSKIF